MARRSGTLSANGDSFTYVAPRQAGYCGVRLTIGGTWGGGTMTLYERGEDGTWRAVTDGAWTANTMKEFAPVFGASYKLTLTGATAPSLYYEFAD